tara:strand:- start:350 stop:853 length:504 start_codon:yes stop_codon:yes gene_type:complete
MIQALTETGFTADICTEDNRIDTSVVTTQIRFLVKFINDLDGSVEYSYPALAEVAGENTRTFPRYTQMNFIYYLLNPPLFFGGIHLIPAGHWKYEVYEVSWIGTVSLTIETAPITETQVLPVSDENGVVQGIVTKGILNLTEKAGTEQVQYTQHTEPSGTNTIYYGQ